MTFSKAAEDRFKALLLAMNKPEGVIRLGIIGGGCSGLTYKVYVEDKKTNIMEWVFALENGVTVVVDHKSYLYLGDMHVDFETTLMRQGFNFNNPKAIKRCGCGSSFSV